MGAIRSSSGEGHDIVRSADHDIAGLASSLATQLAIPVGTLSVWYVLR